MRQRPSRKPVFDAEALRTLDQLFESSWSILELRHPFRDTGKDPEMQAELRRGLFLAAETSGFDDLDQLQRAVLDNLTRSGNL